ncbi:MAG: HAMP domain-containing histidine kinase [Tannerella sp.]|nr:HAMP domain-containing histidine kinase [Tannerella sp.]
MIFFTGLFLLMTLFLFYHTFRILFKTLQDIEDYTNAVRYRDFSKRYPETGSNQNHFYKHFNVISDTFLDMGREKESQQQYLKRILELVNTGILAFDIETMDTLWMNDSFKNMFHVPYVKNINWLKKRHPVLFDELNDIQLGENRLSTINTGNRNVKILSSASTFQTDGKTYLLIAFHNVSATLEEVESGAWKGLLNVMTHEIMNSIAPVASLADTMKKRMEAIKDDSRLKELPDFMDMETAMDTIRRRSEGLLRFADTYRNLSKNFVPETHPVNLHEMLNSIYRLMQPSLEVKGILLKVRSDNTSVITKIDRNLIEQVIINFITNATYAVKDKNEPQISLFSGLVDETPFITVADNGCGIPPEIQDKMFIPFFSTKKTGTGIGLSLSREIIKMHNGSLQVQTRIDEGSAFSILFGKK